MVEATNRRIALFLTVVTYSINLGLIQSAIGLAINQAPPISNNLSPVDPRGPQYYLSDTHPKQLNTSLVNRQVESATRPDSRRPVWNLAHMVNSIKELEYRLSKGANAIEVDVTFSREGEPLYTYHGPPCDCLRHCHQQEGFNDYLSYVREIAIDEPDGLGKNLTLLFLDLKLDPLDQRAKVRAGFELAKSISNNLFIHPHSSAQISSPKKSNLRLILSINHVNDVELVNNFVHYLELNNSTHLLDRMGFDVGMNDDLQLIETMWKRFGNKLNLWQGDGFTNCFSPFYNLERLSKALVKRDQATGYPRKVYQWTIDLHDRMREALRMGVDALMTNHPERLLTVLSEPEMVHNYRLATRDDDPFKRVVLRASQRNNELARHERSASQTSGGFFGSLMDVITSFLAYIREIPFLSLPTTSRLIPRIRRVTKQANSTSLSSIAPATGVSAEFRSSSETNSTMSNTMTEPTTIAIDSRADNLTKPEERNSSSSSLSESVDQILVGSENQVVKSDYEGPKWYTSLASNFLVSVMKIVFPALLDR